MKNIILNFDEMGSKKDAATRAIIKAFAKAKAEVVQGDVSQGVKRTSGISYREMLLTFNDSQTVTLLVKKTGDIYQVKLNGKVIPIKNQDDHQAAVNEIAARMDAGRTAFQKKLAAARVELPKEIKSAAPKIEAALGEKLKALDEAIEATKGEIAKLDQEAIEAV